LERHLRTAHEGPEATRLVVAPRDLVEQTLVDLWQSLLDVRPISITDDFFALGGDSLAAARLGLSST